MTAQSESARGVKWCCPGFQGCWEQAGLRGFGIVVGEEPKGKPFFRMQYRIADAAKEGSITFPNTPIPISPVGEMGLVYCPWCGRNLAERYVGAMKILSRPELLIRPL